MVVIICYPPRIVMISHSVLIHQHKILVCFSQFFKPFQEHFCGRATHAMPSITPRISIIRTYRENHPHDNDILPFSNFQYSRKFRKIRFIATPVIIRRAILQNFNNPLAIRGPILHAPYRHPSATIIHLLIFMVFMSQLRFCNFHNMVYK